MLLGLLYVTRIISCFFVSKVGKYDYSILFCFNKLHFLNQSFKLIFSGTYFCSYNLAFYWCALIYDTGHSRTIIGLEQLNDGSLQLLVFDPSHSKSQMEQFNSTSLNTNAMRLIRRPLSQLKARQYQLVYVDGILDTEDEYQVQ